MLGKDETSRWMNLALYQGAPSKKGLATIVRPSSHRTSLLPLATP